MPDRRKGTSLFWTLFGRMFTGERRTGIDRRQFRSIADRIVFEGCGGDCYQGRRQCNCKLNREKDSQP